RDALALPRDRNRHGVRSTRGRRARHADRGRRERQEAPGGSPQEAPLREGELVAEESYPEDLKYHPEHDWARIEGDLATFGITWFAQDSLGEIVFFDPPEAGTEIKANAPHAEIEAVKAVSDVLAPMSAEVVEVNEALPA